MMKVKSWHFPDKPWEHLPLKDSLTELSKDVRPGSRHRGCPPPTANPWLLTARDQQHPGVPLLHLLPSAWGQPGHAKRWCPGPTSSDQEEWVPPGFSPHSGDTLTDALGIFQRPHQDEPQLPKAMSCAFKHPVLAAFLPSLRSPLPYPMPGGHLPK